MARIFTTSFTFNHRKYDAIVTVINRDNKVSFSVKVMDMDLQELIPEGTVEYDGLDGYEKLECLNNTVSQSLMRSLSQAIESHLSIS
jgi:hypothetical protein